MTRTRQFTKALLVLIQLTLLLSIHPIAAQAEEEFDKTSYGFNHDSYYSRFISEFGTNSKMIANGLTDGSGDSQYFQLINQGFAMTTLMRLYDLYNRSQFIDDAIMISHNIGTYFIDQRYDLAASYYRTDTEIMSNYRYFVDNILAAWALEDLRDTLDPSRVLDIEKQVNRLAYISDDLELFDNGNSFRDFIRVDIEVPTSETFKTYPNLFSSFMILMSEKATFDPFIPTIKNAYAFVKANLTNAAGGVLSIFNGEYADTIINLKNTVLFINVGLRLYELTGEQNYLDDALKSLNYIKTYAKDVSISGGFIEALEEDVPVQQSKSLFSHALILLALLKINSLGYSDFRIDLMSTWHTVSTYFRADDTYQDEFFYSTINRQGNTGSDTINTLDNLMLIFALSYMPNLIKIEYYESIKFSEKMHMNLTTFLPDNTNSTIEVYFDGEMMDSKQFSGIGEIEHIEYELSPPRPSGDRDWVDVTIELTSENVTLDTLHGGFEVLNTTGITLSVQLVTLLSVLMIVVFVLFVNQVNAQREPEEKKTE